ncbi:MAG: TIGR03013 family XrtA/PEP-CTERM system glycosyltransferase [Gammaproteobacteria bacterium]
MTVRLFNHYIPLPIVCLAAAEFLILVLAPYFAGRWLEGTPWGGARDDTVFSPQNLLFALAMMTGLLAVGLYNPRQRARVAGQFARVTVGVFATLLGLAMIYFALPDLALGRFRMLLAAGLAVLGALVVRIVFESTVDDDRFKRSVLVYGAGRQAATIAALRRRSDQRGFRLVGYVAGEGERAVETPDSQLLGRDRPLSALCAEHAIDEIVVAMDDRRSGFPMRELLECRLNGVEVNEVITFLERETGRLQLDVMNPSWMIFSEGFQRGRIHAAFERAFDVLASVLLLTLSLPVIVAVALAIKIEDGWSASVLYRQSRVGQYGREFQLLKFRSMAEAAEPDGRARWAEVNDRRATRVGALIRKLRLDELPQLLNVLRGDMSLVGPRPERPEFVVELEERIPYYTERHNLKPGITGWAQLCYPYGSSEKDAREKLQYDLYYVKNHSLLFYLAILVQTVEVVVWGKGAR